MTMKSTKIDESHTSIRTSLTIPWGCNFVEPASSKHRETEIKGSSSRQSKTILGMMFIFAPQSQGA
jgi:hypothetical protein